MESDNAAKALPKLASPNPNTPAPIFTHSLYPPPPPLNPLYDYLNLPLDGEYLNYVKGLTGPSCSMRNELG